MFLVVINPYKTDDINSKFVEIEVALLNTKNLTFIFVNRTSNIC